jgi:spermidine/putrescine transport system ATP-binding protein
VSEPVIRIEGVTKRFGDYAAVEDVSLDIARNELFALLGPSGCGKTTILRLISGFIEPSDGAVRVGGQDMRGIGPNKRPTALIFQNLALFPLMRVWENIAFGLEVRGWSKAERRRRADELLELIALDGQGDKLVSELSGGQRQRVAVARALAVEPAVLLLDEPLSALDLKLRQRMRSELRAIQKRTGVTFIYITHDQGEALTMSDRIAVMSQGRVEQIGRAEQVYNQPETPFVATFVGESNPFRGRVVEADGRYALLDTEVGRLRGTNAKGLVPGDDAVLFVRPERSLLVDGEAVDNVFDSRITRAELEGSFFNVFVEGADGREMLIHRTNDGRIAEYRAQQPVKVGFAADSAVALPAAGRA